MDKVIVYTGNFSFPNINAAGKRVYFNAKILRDLGYRVVFLGVDESKKDFSTSLEEKEFDGFTYYSFPLLSNLKRINVLKYLRVFKYIYDKFRAEIKGVIYYQTPSVTYLNYKLIKFCNKNGIWCVADIADWLVVDGHNCLFSILKEIDIEFGMRFVNKRANGRICISEYLYDYYKDQKKHAVILPPLCDRTIEKEINLSKKIKFIYAGIPFRLGKKITNRNVLKDRVDIIIKNFAKLSEEGYSFEFNVFGLNENEYLTCFPEDIKYLNQLKGKIKFNGKVNSNFLQNIIAESDFSVLFRENIRTNRAGFSTKIAESISCGTPVITTDVGDIRKYIIDGQTGLFLSLTNQSENIKILRSVLSFEIENRINFKQECMRSNIFYYAKYSKRLEKYLEMIKLT